MVVLADTPSDTAKALTRITAKRAPEKVGYHEELLANQETNFNYLATPLMDIVYDSWRRKIELIFAELPPEEVAIDAFVGEVHEKRALRLASWKERLSDGLSGSNTYITKPAAYKLKKFEGAKTDKYPRGIADLTANGSIRAGHLMNTVKMVMSETVDLGRDALRFVKSPDTEALRSVYEHLLCPDRSYFVYHSDDSCISVRCSDGLMMANMDISSCDGSNREPVFRMLRHVMTSEPVKSAVDGALEQCVTPITVTNPWNPKEKVTLEPTSHVLYSGSTLTTVTNNLANSGIYLRFLHNLGDRVLTRKECEALLVHSAAEVGYIVTLEICEDYHRLQFLKTSPCRDVNGLLVPVLNLGVMLRILGQLIGDLPGRRHEGIEVRAFNFWSQVVKGWVHAGDHPLTEMLRRKYCGTKVMPKDKRYSPESVHEFTGFAYKVSGDEICKRYGCDVSELYDFCELYSYAGIGDCVHTPFSEAVLLADYGLKA
jgi:hypothetical protein